MTDAQRSLVLQFFHEQWERAGSTLAFADWMVDFFLLSKAEQRDRLRTWLTTRQQTNRQRRDNLEADRARAAAALDAENALIDTVLGSV